MLSLEGLTQVNPDGRVAPRLAEKWEWEAEGRRLRLFLRPGVKLHDGSDFAAQRVADTLKKVVADRRAWASYPSLEQVLDVRADGERQLIIDVANPSAFLLEDLSIALRGSGDLGTGPYRVVRSSEAEILLERFDHYYQGTPAIRQVAVRPFKELRNTWASLLRGEVDMVTDVPAGSVEFIQNDEINVVAWQRWYQFVVAFNSGHGPLQSPAVRRAMNIAIDRETLIRNVLQDVASPATGPIWPEYWAYDRDVSPYAFDRSSAEALLDGAGFRPGRSKHPNGIPHARLRFTCLVAEGYSVLERVALEIQRQLYDVGVDMQFETVPADRFDERVRSGKFEAVLVDMISGPSIGRPYLFWRSARNSRGLNVFGYENADAEQLFEILRTSMNDAATLSATRRLQRVLLDDPPALFLAWNARARAVRREFTVYQEPGRDPLSTLWRWTPETAVRHSPVR